MIRLRIVGDGERDAATVPMLVEGILGGDFARETSPWPRLHRREKKVKGYKLSGHGQKLIYALTQARQRRFDGVVATVDADGPKRGEKLSQLKLARDADRSRAAPLPTALGEAVPHNEAWLLDDEKAVRTALGLPPDTPVPTVRPAAYQKTELEALHRSSPRCNEPPLEVWAQIAAHVHEERCNHRKDTGFEAFAAEVRSEIGPLFTRTA